MNINQAGLSHNSIIFTSWVRLYFEFLNYYIFQVSVLKPGYCKVMLYESNVETLKDFFLFPLFSGISRFLYGCIVNPRLL